MKSPEERQSYEGMLTDPVPHFANSSFLVSFSRSVADAASIVHAITPDGAFEQSIVVPSTRTERMARISHDWNERERSALQFNRERSSDLLQGIGGTVLPEAAVNPIASRLRASAPHRPSSCATRSLQVARSRRCCERKTIEAGVQIPNLNKRVYDDHSNQGGTFTFLTLSDYQAGRPYEYTVQQGTTRVGFRWREYGAFVQDQVTINANLHVSLGLRYAWQAFFHDHDNFSPRASLAWSPRKDGSLVVRAGAGVFYDRSGVGPVASLFLHNGETLRSYTILNPSYPDPFANGVTLAGIPTNVTTLAPDVQIPYSVQYSVSVERQLSKSASMVIGYRAARGHIEQIESDGRLKSDALELTLRGRVGKVLSTQLQYTYSKALSNTGGIFWFPANQYAPGSQEWGPTDFDVRHRLNALATLDAKRWGKFGASGKFSSAPPYTLTAGEDLFHTGLSNARPEGVGRNSLRGSGFSSVDLRWSHDLPVAMGKANGLSLSLDAFNVFNHPNFSGYVGNVRSPLCLTPTTASFGRRLQLSLEATFGRE